MTQEDVEDVMRKLAGSDSPKGGWLSKIEIGTNVLQFDDLFLLARALDTSVSYLVGEVEFSAPGWDQLPESDKQELAALIDIKLRRRQQEGNSDA